uniref:MsrB domain-containing protein n=1 Tax=Erythrolobus australicus TaxID=1077150 RepID=A0A7S1XJU7_9RHOD|mmetsp:Transcript_825/g.2255  ORF Transcript_825/g.2255 Transcript_825/m.2255 type:complete len:306 (+) Transcript_825:136-1053(+)|eukprot:CAMPEP_0185834184 /NCGR_PEP_ID=MMETSP1353-20130828/4630_1 /TAXON_ID=1077150 /ORGANISM="Erythrolobus australicus, Strain CCMP3124" /LENGTH=305 /DNA_ID=CAMNT_0028532565 /DNA_START=102 /DNA_END=1019 /DNA_ORIENTATION=+
MESMVHEARSSLTTSTILAEGELGKAQIAQLPPMSPQGTSGSSRRAPSALHASLEKERLRAKQILERPESLRDGKVWMTEGMWSYTLSPAAFASLRRKQFEPPFTGPYCEFRPVGPMSSGIFKCAGCKLPVFAAAEHCGDPTRGYATFRSAIAGCIEKKFNRETSTEIQYHCIRCDGFLGTTLMTGFADDGVSGEIKVSSYSIVFEPMPFAQVSQVLRDCAKREDALSPTVSRRGSSGGRTPLASLSRRSSSAHSSSGVGDDATPSGQSNRKLSKKLSRMASRQATAESGGSGAAALIRRVSSRN